MSEQVQEIPRVLSDVDIEFLFDYGNGCGECFPLQELQTHFCRPFREGGQVASTDDGRLLAITQLGWAVDISRIAKAVGW